MMTLEEYKNRIEKASKNLIVRHLDGEKITYTKIWNEVFFTIFDNCNCAKVNGVHHYMPDTISKVCEFIQTLA